MAKYVLALSVVLLVAGSSFAASPINPALQTLLATNPFQVPNLIVTLREGNSAVLQKITSQTFATRAERVSQLTTDLQAHAALSQKNILAYLTSIYSIQVKSFWVNNEIFVSGASVSVVEILATFPEVQEIRQEKILHILDPIPSNVQIEESPAAPLANQWGVIDISAPEAWALGYTGQEIRIATIDTGARGTHEALRGNYVGANGWFDPYLGTPEPNDQNGHGTHTTANIAGANGYGVAPGAKWMACKGCSTSSCTEEALIACGQWVVCPNGAPPCQNVPHLSSNSWGGGQGDTFYNGVIAAWHAAGITPVFANGNAGPFCTTANSPADQDVIGVGSTNSAHGLSIFSSKGPTVAGDIKPDVSAPGTDVRSAWHTSDTAYSTSSGTSMACPHVAGVVALAKSANTGANDLTYAQVQDVLFKTVDTDLTPTDRNCGGIDTKTFPNNSFGWGKVNAQKAVERVLAGNP